MKLPGLSAPQSINMDPVSAAGIGLAVMSLASQCLTGAIQGTVSSNACARLTVNSYSVDNISQESGARV